jgi:hypothetical protein
MDPIPIHLATNLGVAFPAKPPMSGPVNGYPLNPCKTKVKKTQDQCFVQKQTYVFCNSGTILNKPISEKKLYT